MTTKLKLLTAALVAAFIFGAGCWVTSRHMTAKHSQELADRDRKALAMAEAIKQVGIAANNAISEADTKAWKGLEDDKKELSRLRGCVADRTCGVRLITKYVRDGGGDPSLSSVGNDTVEIDADVQRRVLDHREAIGEDVAKLESLQDYARQCWQATSAGSVTSDTQSWQQKLMTTPLMQESAGQPGR